MKSEIHVLQCGEEVFDVALLVLPDQNHIHLILFILRHPQPFTSLISQNIKKPPSCQDFAFLTAWNIMKHKRWLLGTGCSQVQTQDGNIVKWQRSEHLSSETENYWTEFLTLVLFLSLVLTVNFISARASSVKLCLCQHPGTYTQWHQGNTGRRIRKLSCSHCDSDRTGIGNVWL